MMKFVKKYLGQILLTAFVLLVGVINYDKSTFLSGWDNLHSEFNFLANFKRAVFASWQEYQGLGLVGGMGHASDVFRQLVVWLLSIILPINFVRYFFHFSMLLLGGLGTYFLLKDFILEKCSENAKKRGALGGAFFFLFNLGTLQMFYLPWEAFSVHFGFLPWLFWGVFKYLNNPSKKNLLIFLLINILSVSQGYVATIFLVYLIALGLVLLQCVIASIAKQSQRSPRGEAPRDDKKVNPGTIKKALVILLVTFTVNAFWLLPNLYFALTNVSVNTNAKMNLMATGDNLLKNKEYGNFKNVTLLKGFWFENVELQSSGSTDYIMGDWVKHIQKPWILGIGYLLFGLSILGIFLAIKTKNKKALLFLPVFLVGFTFLANDTFGFSLIDSLLYKLPLVSQIFRFPFTKFSILTAFCLAVFYGVFVSVIASLSLSKAKQSQSRKGLLRHFIPRNDKLVVMFLLLPIIYMFPVFQGKLFYIKEKAQIPQEYFEVFNFFNNQDKNTRIANFPQPSYWGWTNYKWGEQLYSGSGFLWYGIQQPILDRAFDVWSKENENYYWEISQALYSKDRLLFENVLEKYQINWLLVDGNVINPGAGKALFLDELDTMLEGDSSVASLPRNDRFELVQVFGKIKIYKVNLETPVKDFVFIENNLPVVNGYEWGNLDVGFEEFGNYVSVDSHSGDPPAGGDSRIGDDAGQASMTEEIYYPFRSLFTGRKVDELNVEIEDLGDRIVFKAPLPEGLEDYSIELPGDYDGKELVEIDPNTYDTKYFIPIIDSDGKTISVTFPKVKGLLSAEINHGSQNIEAKNCNQFSEGSVDIEEFEGDGGKVRLTAQDANNCGASFYLPNLSHKYAYLISTEAKNIEGKSLLFWLENLTNQKADMEVYLTSAEGSIRSHLAVYPERSRRARRDLLKTEYLIQPPMAEDGLGYTLHFDNISIGREETINELGKVTIYPIPYKFLTELKLVYQNVIPAEAGIYTNNLHGFQIKSGMTDTGVGLGGVNVEHSNPSVYKIKINQPVKENTTLVLSQAYHKGWVAYDTSTRKLLEHVKVNNWENGWQLSSKFPERISSKFNGAGAVQSSKLTGEDTTIVLFFWPQNLQYLGYILLSGCLLIVLIKR